MVQICPMVPTIWVNTRIFSKTMLWQMELIPAWSENFFVMEIYWSSSRICKISHSTTQYVSYSYRLCHTKDVKSSLSSMSLWFIFHLN